MVLEVGDFRSTAETLEKFLKAVLGRVENIS